MSGLSFFSSPLRPASYQSTPIFFSSPQQSSTAWSGFVPPTPSPLKTSLNVNLMSAQQIRKSEGDMFDENALPVNAIQPGDRQAVQDNLSPQYTSSNVPDGTDSVPSFFLSTNSFGAEKSSASASRATQFQYEARARRSSPAAQLTSHTTANRDARKRLFLDRLRNKRDDERSERSGEQLLRMDYMRERRQWELDMERKRLQEVGMHDIDEELVGHEVPSPEIDEPELSPTEDKELEELVSYLQSQDSEEFIENFSDDDDDYDQLFMEVMSQDTQPRCSSAVKSTIRGSPGDMDVDMT